MIWLKLSASGFYSLLSWSAPDEREVSEVKVGNEKLEVVP